MTISKQEHETTRSKIEQDADWIAYMEKQDIDNTEHVLPHNEDSANAEAMRIMSEGNPIEYILDVYNHIHIGDRKIGEVLALSIGSGCISNCTGLHQKLSGDSGKGKSHSCKTMLHLVPNVYWINASLSEKALFYLGENLTDGMTIFSDDIELSPGLVSLIKRSTSEFHQGVEHITVDSNRKGQIMRMPKRITWWLASVENDMDMQILNRQINISIDDSEDTDELVAQQLLQMAKNGGVEYPETFEVQVCRKIYDDIKKMFVSVIIPFTDRIVWNGSKNRRNLDIFLDMIKVYALFNHKQRECISNDDGIDTILASVDDYECAAALYLSRAEAQSNKLTDDEMKIVDYLAAAGVSDTNNISIYTKIPYSKTSRLLVGNKTRNTDGLLGKVSELQVTNVTREDTDGCRRSVKEYELVGYDRIGSYGSIVSLKE